MVDIFIINILHLLFKYMCIHNSVNERVVVIFSTCTYCKNVALNQVV